MRILLDVDGVLADLVGAVCARITCGEYTPEDIHGEFSETLPPEAYVQACDLMRDRFFCSSLLPYPGAQEFLDGLLKLGRVVVVTKPWAGSETWAYERALWLRAHFDIERVIHTAHKYMVRGDVLIEDDLLNIQDWLRENPGGRAVLIDRPWNGNRDAWDRLGRIQRAMDYEHAISILKDK